MATDRTAPMRTTFFRTGPVTAHAIARRQGGFTLIELMITVAVVSVLAAVALPAYKEQIARGKRTDAETALLDAAQYMQRYYAANNSYDATDPVPSLPVQVSPRGSNGAAVNYNLSIKAKSATGFTVQAVPANAMAADKCGTLTYDDQQVRGASGAAVSACWR